MNVPHIVFQVQHNLRIYSDSMGIRMPNPDWARGGAGDGGGGNGTLTMSLFW